jgi:acyl carrier protein
MNELAERLRERLSILLDVDRRTIHDDSSFTDLAVDSMMRLELIAMVEQHVGYEIPENDLPRLRDIRRVLEYVGGVQPA